MLLYYTNKYLFFKDYILKNLVINLLIFIFYNVKTIEKKIINLFIC